MLEVSYDVGPDDIVAFNEHHMSTAPAMRKQLGQIRLMVLSVFVLTAVLFLVLDSPALAAVTAGLGALLALVFTAILRPLARVTIRSMLGRENKLFGAHHATFDDDGVVERTPSGESRTPWSSVERVSITARHIFIHTSPTNALTIPRSAFVSTNDALAFADEATRRVERARPGTAGR